MIRLITLLILAQSFTACFRQKVEVNLSLTAKSAEGAPISSAEVFLNGESIGDTNAFGTLQYVFKAKKGTSQKLEVVKTSSEQYVAPFKVELIAPDSKTYQWDVKADLFIVPKPKARKVSESLASEEDENQSPKEEDEKKDLFGEDSSFALNLKPQPTKLDISQKPKTDKITKIVDAGPSKLVTIHVFSEREPIENAEIWICQDSGLPTLGCTSNARGRCAVEFSEGSKGSSTLTWMVRKKGFQSILSSSKSHKDSNSRVSLVPGKTIEFVTLFNNFGDKSAAEGIQLGIKGATETSSSGACGISILKKADSLAGPIVIKAVHDSVAGSSQEAQLELGEESLSKVELLPKTRKPVHILVARTLPGEGILPVDLNRFFNSETTLKNLKQFESNSNQEATHQMLSVLYRSPKGLVLNVAIEEQSKLVWVRDFEVSALEDSLAKTVDTALKQANQFLKLGDKDKLNIPQKTLAGRWLSLSINPKPLAVYWDQEIMHADFQGVPVLIGNASEVKIKAPPGYLDLEVKLDVEERWSEVGGVTSVNFEPDFAVLAESFAKSKDFEKALGVIEKIPAEHSQYATGLVLKAMILELTHSLDKASLEAVAKLEPLKADQITRMNILAAMSKLIEGIAMNSLERLELAKKMLSLSELVLEKKEGSLEMNHLVLFHRGIAKTVMASLDGDPAMAADGEADLKEFLKMTESTSQNPRIRKLRVAATKNVDNHDEQKF